MSSFLRVSEASSLALHAMAFLAARGDGPMATRHVARTLGVSEAHLSKVFQRLAKAGLVRSVRGPGGGFMPGRSADRITLLEVYEAIEGRAVPMKCLSDKPMCAGRRCLFGTALTEADGRVRKELAGRRLSDLPDVFATAAGSRSAARR